MAGSVQCSYCNTPFEYSTADGSLLATCPYCGKQNAVAGFGHTQRLRLLRNVPTLVGTQPCPGCKTPIERDARICVHCGYNLITGKKLKAARTFPWFRLRRLGVGIVILLGLAYACRRWGDRIPPLTFHPAPEPSPPVLASAALPTTPPPPVPMPGSSSAAPQTAEDCRNSFEQKQIQALQAFRRRLDDIMPLWTPGDDVELRLKTGRIIHATLKYAGRGTNRMVVVATEQGKRILYYKDLDRDSRLRLDVHFREEYIRYTLNLPPAAAAREKGP